MESYQTKPAMVIKKEKNLYELLNAFFEGVKNIFILGYVVAAASANHEAGFKDNRKHFLPEEKINNYDVLIDGRNFYDAYFKDNYKLIAVDLSKKKL